jgi:hypothetical protein
VAAALELVDPPGCRNSIARPRSGQAGSGYQHALLSLITPILGELDVRRGWSEMMLAVAALLMSWDAAPTLAQRFESVLAAMDRGLSLP